MKSTAVNLFDSAWTNRVHFKELQGDEKSDERARCGLIIGAKSSLSIYPYSRGSPDMSSIKGV